MSRYPLNIFNKSTDNDHSTNSVFFSQKNVDFDLYALSLRSFEIPHKSKYKLHFHDQK